MIIIRMGPSKSNRKYRGPLIHFPIHYVPKRDDIWMAGVELSKALFRKTNK